MKQGITLAGLNMQKRETDKMMYSFGRVDGSRSRMFRYWLWLLSAHLFRAGEEMVVHRKLIYPYPD
jgi:hypothetical protein